VEIRRANKHSLILRTYIIFKKGKTSMRRLISIFVHGFLKKYVTSLYTKLCFKHECMNPLNTELNPICHLLALSATHHILHVSRIRVETKSVSWLVGLTTWCYCYSSTAHFPMYYVSPCNMHELRCRLKFIDHIYHS